METPPNAARLTPILSSGERGPQAQLLRSFKVGEIVQALVTSRPDPGTVTLSIKGTTLTAHTGVGLRRGQMLTLRVDTVSPVIQLRLSPPAPPPAANEKLNAALREALPRQAQLATVVNELQIGLNAVQRDRAEPAARSIQALLDALPARGEMRTAAGVRQAFMDSGVFMEAKLAQAPAQAPRPLPVAADLKALLARIVASVSSLRGVPRDPGGGRGQPDVLPAARAGGGPGEVYTTVSSGPAERTRAPDGAKTAPAATPDERAERVPAATRDGPLERASAAEPRPERRPVPPILDARENLSRQAESGLYRIQVQQLSSLADAAPGHGLWRAEIPVATERGVETLKLRIESESNADPGLGNVWSVMLDLESLELGPLLAHISLARGRVSTRFWAERPATLALITGSVHELRSAFADAGLEVGAIACSGEKLDANPTFSARRSIIEAQA